MKKSVLRLILFVCFLLGGIILSVIVRHNSQPETSAKRFENILHQQEERSDEIILAVKQATRETPYIFGNTIENEIHECGFHLFLYYQGVMSYYL